MSAKRLSYKTLVSIAESAYGRDLTSSETSLLRHCWEQRDALGKMSEGVLISAAVATLDQSTMLNPVQWLNLAREIQPGPTPGTPEPSYASVPHSAMCVNCGRFWPPGTICGCAETENSGRPR